MQRLASILVNEPENVLQYMVDSAIALCNADSAGVSLEEIDDLGDTRYHWVAVAGEYRNFLDSLLPSAPSACGVCLDRNRPQLIRATQRFFDILGVTAAPVSDGVLLPWSSGDLRGTIWILAHTRAEAFDQHDLSIMQVFASYASFGILQQQRQKTQHKAWAATAAAAVSSALAQRVNQPLQELTDLVFIGAHGKSGGDAATLARSLEEPLEVLTTLIEEVSGRPLAYRPN